MSPRNLDKWLCEPLVKLSTLKTLTAIKTGFEQLWPYLVVMAFFQFSPSLWPHQWVSPVILWMLGPLLMMVSVGHELSQTHETRLYPTLVLALILFFRSETLQFTPSTFVIALACILVVHGLMLKLSQLVVKINISTIPKRVIEAIGEWLVFCLVLSLILLLPTFSWPNLDPLLVKLFASLGSVIFFIALNTLNTWLWYKGHHGTNVLSFFVVPLSTLGLLANLHQYGIDQTLPYAFSGILHTLYGNYVIFNAIQFWLRLKPKDAQDKALSEHSWVSSLFNINESLIFTFPLVQSKANFRLFISLNAINMLILFGALTMGWVNPMVCVMPFSIPSFLQAGLGMLNINGTLLWIGLWILDILLMGPHMLKRARLARV